RTGPVSEGEGLLYNNNYNNDYNHSLFITRRFKAKKGRTLNVTNTVSYRNNLQRYITESDYNYFYPINRNNVFEQLRRQDVPYMAGTLNANFAEPLSTKWTMRFNNRYELLKDEQDVNLYNKDGANGKYDRLNLAQSSGFERTQNRFNTSLSLSYKLKQVTLTGGAAALWQKIHNEFRNLAQPVYFNLFNVLPNFSLTWKQLSARYDMNVSAPSISYLTPIPDSTNPFFIRYGNPYLRPAKRHSISVNNYSFLQASSSNYSFYLNANIINDDVILKRTVATNGVQTVIPINADGTVQIYANAGYGREFKNKQKFIFNFRFAPYLSFDQRKLNVNNKEGFATTIQYGPAFSLGLNFNDIIEFRPDYRPSISRTRYTDPAFTNINVLTHYLESELIIRWPKNIVWETNAAYRYTNQVQPGLPKDNLLWNAAVTLLMLKDSKGMLKLSVFDVLDRNNSFYQYTTQNQIINQETNVLQRYALLSFTYNIRNMGAPKKVGGRDRLFMF
ncbi:MAG TPA: outer membrane beta-barrel protein, partial [Chitinophagaceae bacterium]|nr:outer membrane beta-barrel protein [Chitinophagaceae bacterium]